MKRALTLLSIAACALSARCAADRPPRSEEPAAAPDTIAEPEALEPPERRIELSPEDPAVFEGLRFRLSLAPERPPPPARPAPTEARPLPPGRAAPLLERLAALTSSVARPPLEGFVAGGPAPPPDPRLGPRLGPGPSPGLDLPGAPTAPEAVRVVPAGPAPELEVARVSPEGEVPTARRLEITFTQPRAPGTPAPRVRMEPQPEGAWRWIGRSTLVFEPAGGRFPMATTFEVEATAPASGKTKRWRFSTPPPGLVATHPEAPGQPLEPVFFLGFDQRVQAEVIAERLEVRAAGVPVAVRLATGPEIAADPVARSLVAGTPPGQGVALTPTAPLPPDAEVTLTLPPGTPSAEGPAVTKARLQKRFRTYGPFQLAEKTCAAGGECPPLAPWTLRFTNPVDPQSLGPRTVTVEPELPGLQVRATEDGLEISGKSHGRTSYRLSLDPELRDVFGQVLGPTPPVTFEVGSARATLNAPGRGLVVLDPASQGRFVVESLNYSRLVVRTWSVTPEDWPAYLRWVSRPHERGAPPGKKVAERVLKVSGRQDEQTRTSLELSPHLEDGLGHLILEVQPAKDLVEGWQTARPPAVRRWIQGTRIGLSGLVEPSRFVAWATNLADGAPLEGAKVQLSPFGAAKRTDADGMAALALPRAGEVGEVEAMLIARHGADVAFVPESRWLRAGTSWTQRSKRDQLRYFVASDRPVYRPGDRAEVKGWVRRVGGAPSGDVNAPGEAVLAWTFRDPRGIERGRGRVPLDPFGGFSLSAHLPPESHRGNARLLLELEVGGERLPQASHTHYLTVVTGRQPELEVKVGAGDGPHFVGQLAVLSAEATHGGGGGLPGAEIGWHVSASPAEFTPPGRSELTFGRATGLGRSDSLGPGALALAAGQTFAGSTDESGTHRLRVDFEGVSPPMPMRVEAEATVRDANHEAWAARTNLLVHPSALYVGLKTPRGFVARGEALEVDALVVDLEGRPVPGRKIELVAAPLEYKRVSGEWRQVEKAGVPCERESGARAVRCSFPGEAGGPHLVRVRVVDDRGRVNESELAVWVAGGDPPLARGPAAERVELIPERRAYVGGEVANILVQAPFYPAEGLVTVSRSGLLEARRFRMKGPSHVLRMKIEEAHLPNLHVKVDLVGQTGAGDAARPAQASGTLNLPVEPRARALRVRVRPAQAVLEPGGSTQLEVELTDLERRPVKDAQVALWVVDEAALPRAGARTPDPLQVFYGQRARDVEELHGRADLVTAELERGEGDGGDAARVRSTRGAEREDDHGLEERTLPGPAGRPALVLFASDLRTGPDGKVSVPLVLDERAARYRVMAVAADAGQRFGSGEAKLAARRAIAARPRMPRTLLAGDRVQIPVTLENHTDAPAEISMAASAVGLELLGPAALAATVPAKGKVEVTLSARAEAVGPGQLFVVAQAGARGSTVERSFEVSPPPGVSTRVAWGRLEAGAVRVPVTSPPDASTTYGGLALSVSGGRLAELGDALAALAEPLGCACGEPLASRVLALVAAREGLAAMGLPGGSTPQDLARQITRAVEELAASQNVDGGWSPWRRGLASDPFVSVHAVHALARARDAGLLVPSAVVEKGRLYLRDIDRALVPERPIVRRAITAYALGVRARLGDLDLPKARAVIRNAGGVEKLQVESAAWLHGVFARHSAGRPERDRLRELLGSKAVVSGEAAHMVARYGELGHRVLYSPNRATALVLATLLEDRPEDPLIPALARGLLERRIDGHWGNTQEDAWATLALVPVLRGAEGDADGGDAEVLAWVDGAHFSALQVSAAPAHRLLPMPQVATSSVHQVVLASEAPLGSLSFRVALETAPKEPLVAARERGLAVVRRYVPVERGEDVVRDTDGSWRIRAGALVRVELDLATASPRFAVKLADVLPAGLEPVSPERPKGGEAWFDHQTLRDQRLQVWASRLAPGVWTHAYLARATTRGVFIAPPATARAAYEAEVFGASRAERVRVE